MSTTYEFYVGRKTKEGKTEAIGPYARREDGYHLIPILERSRNFINWDEFDGCKISPEEFTDEQKECYPGRRVTMAVCSFTDMCTEDGQTTKQTVMPGSCVMMWGWRPTTIVRYRSARLYRFSAYDRGDGE